LKATYKYGVLNQLGIELQNLHLNSKLSLNENRSQNGTSLDQPWVIRQQKLLRMGSMPMQHQPGTYPGIEVMAILERRKVLDYSHPYSFLMT